MTYLVGQSATDCWYAKSVTANHSYATTCDTTCYSYVTSQVSTPYLKALKTSEKPLEAPQKLVESASMPALTTSAAPLTLSTASELERTAATALVMLSQEKPARRGHRWTDSEDTWLDTMVNQHQNLDFMAQSCQRTRLGIKMRILKHAIEKMFYLGWSLDQASQWAGCPTEEIVQFQQKN
jgi:hypothetical protein